MRAGGSERRIQGITHLGDYTDMRVYRYRTLAANLEILQLICVSCFRPTLGQVVSTAFVQNFGRGWRWSD